MEHTPPTNFYTPSGGCIEDVAFLILIQLVLKLVRKFKASLWVKIPPNVCPLSWAFASMGFFLLKIPSFLLQ